MSMDYSLNIIIKIEDNKPIELAQIADCNCEENLDVKETNEELGLNILQRMLDDKFYYFMEIIEDEEIESMEVIPAWLLRDYFGENNNVLTNDKGEKLYMFGGDLW